MSRHFDIVTIIGVGLLGGSLGLALKARGMASAVRGVGHRQTSLDKAVGVGAVDAAYLNIREAVPGSDLVVVCTPAAAATSMLDDVLPLCSPRTIVTDVTSTKAGICTHARNTWPHPSRFVGSHPMAGSEKFGPEHADARLFEGCAAIVETGDHLDGEARQAVCDLWRGVGSHVVDMDPALHDAIVARTSHVPHILAACIASAAGGKGDVRALVGQGFRDVTRIAASRPDIWRDICLTNRDAILEGLDEIEAEMDVVRRAIRDGRCDELDTFFEKGRSSRREVLGE